MDGLVYILVIGLATGWLAGKFMKVESIGFVGTLVVGVVGAVLGGFLFGLFGLIGLIGNLISATVGAVVLLFILRIVMG
jgi:uncharacterized membrane protein YeaQ/YmgE (transglycosylase-associated protein family)